MDKFLNAKIYTGKIDNEISKPDSYRCFNGAWYYKALSSKDYWLGIDAVVTLPLFEEDKERFAYIHDSVTNKEIIRYNDTPSVYVGVCSDFENDIGFAWFRGIIDGKITDEKFTFRPFYRYIYKENGKEVNTYKGSKIEEVEYYYFPGDKVRITVVSTSLNHLRFRIELLEPTKIEKYQKIRDSLSKPNKIFLSEEFPAPGAGINLTEVKRVNAIDQYGNEGKPTQMTNAKVNECIWEDVYLFREVSGEIVKVPFTSERFIRMLCPMEEAFIIKEDKHKEIVIINPGVVSK